jgi:DMSO/TMAO reductase YedYZ molybdopterin-dependent catalytic subunit
MPMLTRRAILRSGLGLSGSLVFGCSSQPLAGTDAGATGQGGSAGAPSTTMPDAGCDDLLAGGTRRENQLFIGESTVPLNQPFNQGLDGRLYTDLSTLSPGQLIIPNADFYVRTRYPDLLVPENPWRIRVSGLVASPTELVLDDLLPLAAPQGTHLMECSGNARGASFGLLSSADWEGIKVSDVLARIAVSPGATRLLVSGFDQYSAASTGNSLPGASWVFSFEDLAQTGAFFATRMSGEPLPPDHGAPVRLVVPGWYGCTCIKWVNELVLVDDTTASTAQMREFAGRTQQTGVPELAAAFQPAAIDSAAMPIRVEQWSLAGSLAYRVVGIIWGGSRPVSSLEIRFGSGAWEPVSVCPAPSATNTWSLWTHLWRPAQAGSYTIVLRVPDRSVTTRRLDSEFYLREVQIDAV